MALRGLISMSVGWYLRTILSLNPPLNSDLSHIFVCFLKKSLCAQCNAMQCNAMNGSLGDAMEIIYDNHATKPQFWERYLSPNENTIFQSEKPDYLWLIDGDVSLTSLNWNVYWKRVLQFQPLISQPAIRLDSPSLPYYRFVREIPNEDMNLELSKLKAIADWATFKRNHASRRTMRQLRLSEARQKVRNRTRFWKRDSPHASSANRNLLQSAVQRGQRKVYATRKGKVERRANQNIERIKAQLINQTIHSNYEDSKNVPLSIDPKLKGKFARMIASESTLVEIMTPLLRWEVWEHIYYTVFSENDISYEGTIGTWGLDYVWCKMSTLFERKKEKDTQTKPIQMCAQIAKKYSHLSTKSNYQMNEMTAKHYARRRRHKLKMDERALAYKNVITEDLVGGEERMKHLFFRRGGNDILSRIKIMPNATFSNDFGEIQTKILKDLSTFQKGLPVLFNEMFITENTTRKRKHKVPKKTMPEIRVKMQRNMPCLIVHQTPILHTHGSSIHKSEDFYQASNAIGRELEAIDGGIYSLHGETQKGWNQVFVELFEI